ncbi:Tetratricopeptide repeat protein [Rosistilla oblonga]|uniref:Tetratricopeptide repeat protein n=1 Tax=Rosistilla oblonga TaxID=2527990 RepID=A0A518IVK3_9BACT|nr:tetratricopeptide repeat protein [Rosistilla oblonga]QDV14742.1 Tetratricopeptide repeat protein [Rosistilla oblonga]QDV57112.1 Tetratricopeptide repeat protein [Rosistilla oblonga]
MSVSKLRYYQNYRSLRQAQGLLELISCNDDLWGLDPEIKRRLARRALAMLQGARPRGHRRAAWYYLRGRAWSMLGKYHRGIRTFRRAAKLDPHHIATYLSLAWCLKRVDRLEQSISILNHAIARAPHHPLVRYNQACYLSLAGQPQLAAMELSIALELKPDLRSKVAREADFDPIRNHPAFDAALQVVV